METTLRAMRSSVTAQSGLPSTATAACAALGWPVSPPGGGGPGAVAGGGAGSAVLGGPRREANRARRLAQAGCTQQQEHSATRGAGVASAFKAFLAAEQHDQPHHAEQHEAT